MLIPRCDVVGKLLKKPTTGQAAPGLEPGTSRLQSGALGASDSRSAFGFIISGAPHFRNPYLTKVTNQLGSTLRRHLFDISRTFEITVSVFPPLF
jgi:hypothetical protein